MIPSQHGNLQWDNCHWFSSPHWPAAFRWTRAAESRFNCPLSEAGWQGLHATICHRQTASLADLTYAMWGRARVASAICHSKRPVTLERGRGRQYADWSSIHFSSRLSQLHSVKSQTRCLWRPRRNLLRHKAYVIYPSGQWVKEITAGVFPQVSLFGRFGL